MKNFPEKSPRDVCSLETEVWLFIMTPALETFALGLLELVSCLPAALRSKRSSQPIKLPERVATTSCLLQKTMKLNLRVAGQPPLGLECGEGTSVAELKAMACAAAQDPGPVAERKLVHRSSLLRSGTVGQNGVEDGGVPTPHAPPHARAHTHTSPSLSRAPAPPPPRPTSGTRVPHP